MVQTGSIAVYAIAIDTLIIMLAGLQVGIVSPYNENILEINGNGTSGNTSYNDTRLNTTASVGDVFTNPLLFIQNVFDALTGLARKLLGDQAAGLLGGIVGAVILIVGLVASLVSGNSGAIGMGMVLGLAATILGILIGLHGMFILLGGDIGNILFGILAFIWTAATLSQVAQVVSGSG